MPVVPKGFNVEDITHHSKRTQAENIAKAGTSFNLVMGIDSDSGVISTKGLTDISTDILPPENITLESAIQFFKSVDIPRYDKLFKFTADILDKYRKASRTALNKMLQESENKDPETPPNTEDTITVDMSNLKGDE